MKSYKRLICLLMTCLLVFSMSACGQKASDKNIASVDKEEIENIEETKDEYVRIVDFQDISFLLPKDVVDLMYSYESVDDFVDEHYYKDVWTTYVNVFKGDYSEIVGIEVIEHTEYIEEVNTAEDVLEYIFGSNDEFPVQQKEIIKKEENSIIARVETSEGFELKAGDEHVEIIGEGYVFCIREEERDFIGLFLSKNEVPEWFLKTIESVSSVDFLEYKLSKSELDKNLDKMTNIKIMGNTTLDIPYIAYDNRVNAFGLFLAIDDELIEYNKEDIYFMVDEDYNYFTIGTTDMTFAVMAEFCSLEYDEFNLERVEDVLGYSFDVTEFEGEEVKSNSSSKIFKVSFNSEDEGLDGNEIVMKYYGHVGLFDIDDDSIIVIAVYDKESDWTFDTIKSVKIGK